MSVKPYPVTTGTGTWVNSYTFRDEEGLWYTRIGSYKVYKVTDPSQWRTEPNRFLGRKIRSKPVKPPYPRRVKQVRVYFGDHLKTISESQGAAPTYLIGEDRPALSNPQLQRRYRVSSGWAPYWANKPSKIRPGEKALRSDDAFNRSEKGPRKRLIYDEEDSKNILAGDESVRPGTGWTVRRDSQLEKVLDRQQHARDFLISILSNGRMPRSKIIAAGKQQGISETRLWREKEPLGIKTLTFGEMLRAEQGPENHSDFLSAAEVRSRRGISLPLLNYLYRTGIVRGEPGGKRKLKLNLADVDLYLARREQQHPSERYWELPEELRTAAATQAGQQNGQHAPVTTVRLSDRQRLILETMVAIGAISEGCKATHDQIVKKIHPQHDPNNYKRDFAALHKKGMIDSIRGPEGGVWLTSEGALQAGQN